jgi:L-iditol 2-dehydrogenase
MRAAVYVGHGRLSVETVPVPEIGPGELLVRVEACGICHTDLKKIEQDLLPPPRIFGHETAGVVVEAGAGVQGYQAGDRVAVFHHVPCLDCFYCRRKLYAQCATYKKVGTTAGYEPAGGGFAEYVRVMNWIVARGVEKVPDGVSFERACLLEPLNTCLKAVKAAEVQAYQLALVLGQGPIGLLFTLLARRTGARVVTTDPIEHRRQLSVKFGAEKSWHPEDGELAPKVAAMSAGRGADVVIIAASFPGAVEEAVRCSRPGGRILLFAQTSRQEKVELPGADICVGERTILGCYSASIDLQEESARLVFEGELPLEELISDRTPLGEIERAIEKALHPDERSLKIVVQPQR